ncbi:MAG: hypothetical protein M4579_003149 [Chaenotheca gracillima]|nr:MAG: hypothetical protein M4579_003149 [Chaenotheca gracillima]
MDMPVNVPVDDPNADTEWNDILRKHKIIPEKPPSPTPIIEEALTEARRLAHENRLEGKDLEELDELEDEEDEEFLQHYRNKRMTELNDIAQASVFGDVYPISKPDYSRDVTEASRTAYVLVHLTSSQGKNTESRVLSEIWRTLARKFGDIKFCEIRADQCIEGYPEKNCPTILAYHNEDIVKQVVTLAELNGVRTKQKDVESLLISISAVDSGDHRVLPKPDDEDDESKKGIRSGHKLDDDSDDDWE